MNQFTDEQIKALARAMRWAYIENIATLAAVVGVCWVTNSPWGLLLLLNMNTPSSKK
jgi:hypothetical protein